MIKTNYSASMADVRELFRENGFRLAPMAIAERDVYDGTLTLSDDEEHEGGMTTVLWVYDHGRRYVVAVYDEDGVEHDSRESHDMADALGAYEEMTLEYGTNATSVTM